MIRIAFVGCGAIAPEYLKAVRYGSAEGLFKASVISVANRTVAGNERGAQLGIPSTYLDIDTMIQAEKPDAIFCMVGAPQIYSVALQLIPYGIPILLEKPPGLTAAQTRELSALSIRYRTNVMVALNRRFYSIVEQAGEIIKQAGGLLGMRMDGFERYRQYKELGFNNEKLESLLYTNTIHCIDLIRHYAGQIQSVQSFVNDKQESDFKHRYAAMMTSSRNVPITFQSYWNSYGNWRYELYIPDGKICFTNLETAIWERYGLEPVELVPAQEDQQAKPGFVRQIAYFINHLVNDTNYYEGTLSLEDAIGTMELIEKIDVQETIK